MKTKLFGVSLLLILQSLLLNSVLLAQEQVESFLNSGELKSGVYYIRNKASGKYINGGGAWGTQGVLELHPMATAFKQIYDGVFVLNSGFENPNNHYNQWGLDGDNKLFLELGHDDECLWRFIPTQTGYYSIQSLKDEFFLYDVGDASLKVGSIERNNDAAPRFDLFA